MKRLLGFEKMHNICRCWLLFLISARVLQALPTAITEESAILHGKTSEILKYMNESIDPCVDFYEYSCGNYGKFNPATLTNPRTGILVTLINEHEKKIKSLLADEDSQPSSLSPTAGEKKLKIIYKSCLNLPTLEELTYSEKMRQLIGEFGKMPALEGDQWKAEDFNWLQTIAEITFKYDLKILLDIEVSADFSNKSVNNLYISEPEFELSKAIYLAEKIDTTALALMAHDKMIMQTFLGLNDSQAMDVAKANWYLERDLAQGAYDELSDQQFTDAFELSTYEEFEHKYNNDLNLKSLVVSALGSIPKLKLSLQKAYFENLLAVAKATPPRTLANYIFFKLINAFVYHVYMPAEEIQELCIDRLKTYFYRQLDNMVYHKYNTQASEKAINHMWEDIKSSFKNLLSSPGVDWISGTTLKYAVEKLEAMKLHILAYDSDDLLKNVEQLNVVEEDYIEILKTIMSNKAEQKRSLDYLVPQKVDFGKTLTTSPVYNPLENTVMVPVFVLNPNYIWSASFPYAINYGAMGFLLAHELLHGFDASGRSYDAQGNSRSWWDGTSTTDFNRRSKCFINQYQQYIYGGQHLSALLNQDENIADNGGVRVAYEAYLTWYDNAAFGQHQMEQLKGRNFSHQQVFFISFAQLWCSVLHPAYLMYVLASDQHVPGKFRVIGSLSNYEEFSKAFKCPVGSAMNPVKKCEIY